MNVTLLIVSLGLTAIGLRQRWPWLIGAAMPFSLAFAAHSGPALLAPALLLTLVQATWAFACGRGLAGWKVTGLTVLAIVSWAIVLFAAHG